jgi:hypothetical protein
MRVTIARVLAPTALAAVVAFSVVQDRVTAAGAQAYVEAQRQALARGTLAPTIDGVMRPAVRRSVVAGALSAAAVLACGLGGAALVALRSRRG